MRSRREAILERQQQQGAPPAAVEPPPPAAPPPQLAPPPAPAMSGKPSGATQCNVCKIRFLTSVAKRQDSTGAVICLKCGSTDTSVVEVAAAPRAAPQAPPPISPPQPPPPETEAQQRARVKAAIEQGITLSGNDAVLARHMIAEATQPAMQQAAPPLPPPIPPPQQQQAAPPLPMGGLVAVPPAVRAVAQRSVGAMMEGLAQDPADEGTEVTVCWGEEKFSPMQYNSFGVGPFFAKGKTRPGESIYDASQRLMQDIAAFAERERSRKVKDYLAALQEVLHATGNQR